MYIWSKIPVIVKFRWESGFLKGSSWNPCTNGRLEYLMQLNVNIRDKNMFSDKDISDVRKPTKS